MELWLHFLVHLHDCSVGSNQKRTPPGYPIESYHALPSIREERKGETVLLGKLFMARYRVCAHPEHSESTGLKAGEVVADGARLFHTSRCIILGVKIQKHPAAAIFGKGMQCPVLIGERKVGGMFSLLWHRYLW